MIPRYDRPEMSSLWSDQAKFSTYLKVELAIMKAFEQQGIIPQGTADHIEKSVEIRSDRIDEIEATVRHDIIAFCTSITEQVEPKFGQYFHYGVTSSDIIDTSLTCQIKESLDTLFPIFENFLKNFFQFAEKYADQVCMGRSHGIYAEPMSFGQKMLGHFNEFYRRYQDYKNFYNHELTGQFSGAVGNYTVTNTKLEETALAYLGLKPELASTQVIPRDRLAKLVQIGALFGSALERVAVEIRHLHRSDVAEVSEGFRPGQKGSSIMPHKKNPIAGENLTGMARLLRSHASIALDNVVLWHERDISHSSTERVYLPDHFTLLAYSLHRLNDTISRLEVHTKAMEQRVLNNPQYLSSYYLHQLLDLTELKREDLYPLLQQTSFQLMQKAQNGVSMQANSFKEELDSILEDNGIQLELKEMDFDQLKSLYLSEVETIFSKAKTKYTLNS